MKKGKMLYLWLIIIIFIILWIPYFENIAAPVEVIFFGGAKNFIGLYPMLLFLGLVEGTLIVLYVQSLLKDVTKDEPKKFDL